MVSQMALDYMHLVCLGVTKRLLSLWVKGSRDVQLDNKATERVSEFLVSYKKCVTPEFSRLPRSPKDVNYWKANEFRLYGAGRMTYNTHNLIHLPADVMNFKCSLDRFS
ncbi:uncharacterized protein LOC113378182 [Ctenocephalides felis]|uniref:uncharacterized protein LOC113378182 n=1 Tax=Ctenocephalides felis TaxID=7515 RepID=UPI000E6E52C7|nr:uncharacterized protein LOC113378182 [Ctenocephalides felis]